MTATLHRGSLLHSSAHIMLTTVLTGGLGAVFWVLAARSWDAREVGVASAALSLCTLLSLIVHLGPAALMIERLPRWEGTDGLAPRLWTAIAATAGLSAVLAAVVLWAIRDAALLAPVAHSPLGASAFVVGCAAWSALSVLSYAFVALGRAEQMSSQNTTVSVAKLALLPVFGVLVGARLGSVAMLGAWAFSAVLGCWLSLAWQLPKIGVELGRPRFVRPGVSGLRSAIGHHLTSAGGMIVPFVLPLLVAALLSAADNAYFAITWLLASLFFMVSPAVAGALFATAARGDRSGAHVELAERTRSAVRLTTLLLAPAMLVMLIGGHLVLSVFGARYASQGYGLLVVLVLATVPDAVNNLAVALCRATGRLAQSAVLNLAMAAVCVGATLLLIPHVGIVGVGLAWALGQCLGAIWSLPVVLRQARLVPA